MIPSMIAEAAKDGGWDIEMFSDFTWFGLTRGDLSVHAHRDQWRHLRARAFRGDALTALFSTQRDLAAYLIT